VEDEQPQDQVEEEPPQHTPPKPEEGPTFYYNDFENTILPISKGNYNEPWLYCTDDPRAQPAFLNRVFKDGCLFLRTDGVQSGEMLFNESYTRSLEFYDYWPTIGGGNCHAVGFMWHNVLRPPPIGLEMRIQFLSIGEGGGFNQGRWSWGGAGGGYTTYSGSDPRLTGLWARAGNEKVKIIGINPNEWHNYTILWHLENTTFLVDGDIVAVINTTYPGGSGGLEGRYVNRAYSLDDDGNHVPGELLDDPPPEEWMKLDHVHLYTLEYTSPPQPSNEVYPPGRQ
jgi:hypothetical protein